MLLNASLLFKVTEALSGGHLGYRREACIIFLVIGWFYRTGEVKQK